MSTSTKKSNHLIFIILLIFSTKIWGQEIVPSIIVEAKDEESLSNIEDFSTNKVEGVDLDKFSQPQRQTLADLVKDQVGVNTQTYCSNCGAKRLTINGLKAEHTSILIDGLPLHSAVSSFYGVDSIPINGIEKINVMRGTGASLTNPEAIGGTLDLVTIDPLKKRQSYSTSLSINDKGNGTAQNHSVIFSNPSKSKKFGISLGAQFTRNESWDEDENGIAESPQRENSSALLKMRFLPSDKNDIKFRAGYSDLTILGGPTDATKPTQVRPIPANGSDFQNNNVERRYLGDPNKITDWVSLKRYEGTLHWTHFLDDSKTVKWNSGFARQEQRAIYQHGFDYANNDVVFVSDLSLEVITEDNHLFKFGLFVKNQELRSSSQELFINDGLPADHFDNLSIAAYSSFTFIQSNDLEMDFALRVDQTSINWLELTNKIDELVIAPRYQLRHSISEHLTQRVSLGLGYRSPLTFFESQHGNEENGYKINITELEKASSAVYSLSYNTPKGYATLGIHYTNIYDMAFGQESSGNPIVYQNANEDYEVWTNDFLVGYKIKENWLVEASLELFKYEDDYSKKLPTAAIEKRLQLKSKFESKKWKHIFTATMVGSRNLSRYGRYTNHYVDRNQFPAPEQPGNQLKDQRAPTYFVLDTSFTYSFSNKYDLSFGINNILNETQTKRGDSPSMWHWHFDHAHYDGLHTWGPNRGREIYFQFTMNL